MLGMVVGCPTTLDGTRLGHHRHEDSSAFDVTRGGAEYDGALEPGESRRYILGAKKGQDLHVRLAHRGGPRTEYQILNPDKSVLLDMITTDKEYRGQLWQSGDHVVEVINRGGATADYTVICGID